MYEGQQCPVCKEQFVSGDDIVVCPQCGAPHHRACFEKNGECAFESKHSSNFVYEKENTQSDNFVEQFEAEVNGSQNHSEHKDGDYCKCCGAKLIEGSEFCIYCGQKKNSPVSNVSVSPTFCGKDPMGGIDAKEKIETSTARELAESVRINSDKYIPKFKKLASRKSKLSWSWSAAFFGRYYYFFRKMYFAGIVLIALQIMATQLINMFMGDPITDFIKLVGPIYESGSYSAMQAEVMKILQVPENRTVILYAAIASFSPLLFNFVFAPFSNLMYLRTCEKRILKAKDFYEKSGQSMGISYHLDIVRRGGISIMGILLAYFAASAVSFVISWLVSLF